MDSQQNNQQGSMGTGYLIVRVTTAGGAIPLEGADVSVYGLENGDRIATLKSDRDGNTETLPLSTPVRGSNPARPYFSYRITVKQADYFQTEYRNVPIFPGIISIQPATLIPLPENGGSQRYPSETVLSFDSSYPSEP